MKEEQYKPRKLIPRQSTEDTVISDADENEINISAILRWAGVEEYRLF